ncbi:hypothetical protein EBBID32_46090 [Sphingobium indicum BiD32]|uniref:Uncharacterized protein n=1 Tax=Sphingobium indicum BiD32 TaxID=1301087 RepID=N1MST4_9SPHN|nr:hypothetical protein EBBID32_46090 [Sphingobium indicum BiD32]
MVEQAIDYSQMRPDSFIDVAMLGGTSAALRDKIDDDIGLAQP